MKIPKGAYDTINKALSELSVGTPLFVKWGPGYNYLFFHEAETRAVLAYQHDCPIERVEPYDENEPTEKS